MTTVPAIGSTSPAGMPTRSARGRVAHLLDADGAEPAGLRAAAATDPPATRAAAERTLNRMLDGLAPPLQPPAGRP